MGWLVTVGAALWLGFGFVLQQRAAQREADADHPLRLILELLRRPAWIAGIGSMITGQILSAWALGHWNLTFVEPVLATNVVFALFLAIPLSAQTLRRREVFGAFLLVAGVITFTLLARSGQNQQATPGSIASWLPAAVVAAVAAVLVRFGWRRPAYERATIIGAGAGMIFGIQDALTRRSVRLLIGAHPLQILTTWSVYVLVIVAVVGIVLMQDAFGSAPLRASLPAITAAEPVAGIVLGVVIFGDALRLNTGALAGELAGIAAMVVGVILVAHAPLLVEPHSGASSPKQSQGRR